VYGHFDAEAPVIALGYSVSWIESHAISKRFSRLPRLTRWPRNGLI